MKIKAKVKLCKQLDQKIDAFHITIIALITISKGDNMYVFCCRKLESTATHQIVLSAISTFTNNQQKLRRTN